MLHDLKQRLKHTRWPDEVETTGWDYGTNVGYMKEPAVRMSRCNILYVACIEGQPAPFYLLVRFTVKKLGDI